MRFGNPEGKTNVGIDDAAPRIALVGCTVVVASSGFDKVWVSVVEGTSVACAKELSVRMKERSPGTEITVVVLVTTLVETPSEDGPCGKLMGSELLLLGGGWSEVDTDDGGGSGVDDGGGWSEVDDGGGSGVEDG